MTKVIMRRSDTPCEVDRSTGYMKLSFALTVGKYKIDPITIRLPEDLILKIWNALSTIGSIIKGLYDRKYKYSTRYNMSNKGITIRVSHELHEYLVQQGRKNER